MFSVSYGLLQEYYEPKSPVKIIQWTKRQRSIFTSTLADNWVGGCISGLAISIQKILIILYDPLIDVSIKLALLLDALVIYSNWAAIYSICQRTGTKPEPWAAAAQCGLVILAKLNFRRMNQQGQSLMKPVLKYENVSLIRHQSRESSFSNSNI